MLLEVCAIDFNAKTSPPRIGQKASTFGYCRELISFPRIRSSLMDFLALTTTREVRFEAFDRGRALFPWPNRLIGGPRLRNF